MYSPVSYCCIGGCKTPPLRAAFVNCGPVPDPVRRIQTLASSHELRVVLPARMLHIPGRIFLMAKVMFELLQTDVSRNALVAETLMFASFVVKQLIDFLQGQSLQL